MSRVTLVFPFGCTGLSQPPEGPSRMWSAGQRERVEKGSPGYRDYRDYRGAGDLVCAAGDLLAHLMPVRKLISACARGQAGGMR